jgi:hypothetical protein
MTAKLRRRFKQTTTLKERLQSFAKDHRDRAAELRPGPQKDALMKKARSADTASHIDDWANSAELEPPK